MERAGVSQAYEAACADHGTSTNPRLAEVLKETPETENFTVKLAGNSRARLGDEDASLLCQCLRRRCVAGLELSYNRITGEGAAHLAGLLQEEKSTLRFLDLRFNDILADGAEILSQSLRCNSSLLALRLSGNKLGNGGAMHLAATLQVNRTLRQLELADCDLATQSVVALMIALKSNDALRSLDISRPLLFSHQEEWAVHCSEMLAANRGLVELHLGKMGMTDAGVERLADGLRLNRVLRYLDLRCNRVTRDGARRLAEALTRSPALEVLDLSSNRIEDEGAAHLGAAVARPGCSLRELSVCGNGVGTHGLLALAVAMETGAASLTHLYVWGNRLEEEPVCQAFSQLMSSGRLLPEHTDVSAYEVDGRVFLAEVAQKLRRRWDGADPGLTSTDPSLTPA